MDHGKVVSENLIKRLLRYYKYLSELYEYGINRVSSKELANRIGITDCKVRQDLLCVGGKGLRGYGYDVDTLLKKIRKFFGLSEVHNAIVIGAGNLGQTLVRYSDFSKVGFRFEGIFDVSDKLIGERVGDLEIMHLDFLPDFIKKNHVVMAALAVPNIYVKDVIKLVTDLGIKSLWNFTSLDLKVPDDVTVENIHLSDSLMLLRYRVSERCKQ